MTLKTTIGLLFVSVALSLHVGCDASLANLTASLGGSSVGGRGTLQVVVINNTPHTAVFVMGTFDPTDEASAPDFRRFVLDGDGAVLSGDSQSIVYRLLCGRVFGVGSPDLLESIRRSSTQADAVDLTEGVRFFDDDSVAVGTAPAFEALLGVDFPCSALLIVRLEFDDLGPHPFRVDFELIPSAATQ